MRRLMLLCLALVPGWGTGAEPDAEPDCAAPKTTYDFNMCGSREAQRADEEMLRYLEAAMTRVARDAESRSALEVAQKSWEAYRSSHCGAVYTLWREGTIRGPKGIACQIALTRQRTHEVWLQYLRPVEKSAPPLLPEPPQ